MVNLERKKYPIGQFKRPEVLDKEILLKWVNSISTLPHRLREVMTDISEDELETQYRPGSWTVRQIVHHIADSHMNGYIRIKLTLTEDHPTIKPFDENAWANLSDVDLVHVEVSLALLEAIHKRWVSLVQSLNSAEWNRTFYHPENEVTVSIAEQVGLYAWHGEHHLSHIINALKQQE